MKSFLLLTGACFWLITQSFGHIIYVNASATGANDGTTWADAFTNLSVAIADAEMNSFTVDSLFIAEGVYIPDFHPTAQYPVYICPPQIALFGGFPTTGTPAFSDRDWLAHPTVLDGDVLGDDDGTVNTRFDNARRLLILDTYAQLDGIRVQNGGDVTGAVGAGVTISGTNSRSALIQNCVFANNWVVNMDGLAGDGGGIRGAAVNTSDVLEIRNVVFINNKAKFGGGLIYAGQLKSNNCYFIENEAELGSAIAMSGPGGTNAGAGTIVQNVFFQNRTFGGTNQGDRSGVIGRLNAGNGELRVWNSTFKDNFADSVAIVYSGRNLQDRPYTEFNNCLMDESNDVPAIAIQGRDSITLNNCVGSFTAGWPTDLDSIVDDGNFVNAHLTLNQWQEGANLSYLIEEEDEAVFVLDCLSPGVGAGSNALLPGSLANGTDLLGNPRISGGAVDVGAYETPFFDLPLIEQQGPTLQVTNGPYDNYQWFLDGTLIAGATQSNFRLGNCRNLPSSSKQR